MRGRIRSLATRMDRVDAQLTDLSADARVLFLACSRAVMTEAGRNDPHRFPPLTTAECRRWRDVPTDALGFGLSASLRRVARRRLEVAP